MSPAQESLADIDFDVVNIRGEFDEPSPDKMDPMLDFIDENDEVYVPIGWKRHVLKASTRKFSGLEGNYIDRDTIPKSSAPYVATEKNVPAGTTSAFEFLKLFFNLQIIMGDFQKQSVGLHHLPFGINIHLPHNLTHQYVGL